MRTRIKICGVCRVEDARAAAAAGADAIGLVLHPPAARFVSDERAAEIIAALPPFVTPVGLFVDALPDEVRESAGRLQLRCVQLHGHEDPACVAALSGLIVLKALRVARDTFGRELLLWRKALGGLPHLRGFVLETAASAPGGTGVANDWDFICQCRAEGLFNGLPPLIAAGGLTPETVSEVVRRVEPWAVDVSSGVEVAKGIKSGEKLTAFGRAVRDADDAIAREELAQRASGAASPEVSPRLSGTLGAGPVTR